MLKSQNTGFIRAMLPNKNLERAFYKPLFKFITYSHIISICGGHGNVATQISFQKNLQ